MITILTQLREHHEDQDSSVLSCDIQQRQGDIINCSNQCTYLIRLLQISDFLCDDDRDEYSSHSESSSTECDRYVHVLLVSLCHAGMIDV